MSLPDGMPEPKFYTRRDPAFETRGTRQADFARIWLGKPLMPAQQYIADVLGEHYPDGRPRYPFAVVTMPRRGGKSHLCMARTGERCLSVRNFRSFYTAQDGGAAQDQFLKFCDEEVAPTPLSRIVTIRRGNGKADMRFPNGSSLRPVPPTEGTGHGKESDLYDIDEAWYFNQDQGKAILQAVGPTQMTRPNAQIVAWSAGGTAASTWLAALVARGRSMDPTMAYFEWGMPDDMPIDDLEGIARCHPAYGHTIDLSSIQALRQLYADDDAGFARAAGNRWTEIIGGAITTEQWNRVRWADPIPESAPIGWGAARAADGSHTVLAAAAQLPDGLIVVEIVAVVGVNEAAATIKAHAAGEALVVDPSGPSAALADELARLKIPTLPFSARDVGAACTNVLDALDPKLYRYRPHPALDAAVKVAGTRAVGDGGKAWARVAAGAPIAAIEAASNAVWALTHRPRKVAKPRIHFREDAA